MIGLIFKTLHITYANTVNLFKNNILNFFFLELLLMGLIKARISNAFLSHHIEIKKKIVNRSSRKNLFCYDGIKT